MITALIIICLLLACALVWAVMLVRSLYVHSITKDGTISDLAWQANHWRSVAGKIQTDLDDRQAVIDALHKVCDDDDERTLTGTVH